MDKKYLAKIIAKDLHGLKLISAFCSEAKVKITDVKYLKKNQIFLIFLKRLEKEVGKNDKKINSICKFEFVKNVKSKNIDQNNDSIILELITIDALKNNDKFLIHLFFNKNSCITLSTEIIEVTLEDQKI